MLQLIILHCSPTSCFCQPPACLVYEGLALDAVAVQNARPASRGAKRDATIVRPFQLARKATHRKHQLRSVIDDHLGAVRRQRTALLLKQVVVEARLVPAPSCLAEHDRPAVMVRRRVVPEVGEDGRAVATRGDAVGGAVVGEAGQRLAGEMERSDIFLIAISCSELCLGSVSSQYTLTVWCAL